MCSSDLIYTVIGRFANVSLVFDPQFRDDRVSLDLSNVTLEQALTALSASTRTFFKVTAPRTITVIPDTAAKRREYEEDIVRTFYLSNADLRMANLAGANASNSTGPLVAAGTDTVYFAGYKALRDRYKIEEIERAADAIVWCCDEAPGFTPGRPQDRTFVGNIVQAIHSYAIGNLGNPEVVSLKNADRVIAIGSDRMMAAVAHPKDYMPPPEKTTTQQPRTNPCAALSALLAWPEE